MDSNRLIPMANVSTVNSATTAEDEERGDDGNDASSEEKMTDAFKQGVILDATSNGKEDIRKNSADDVWEEEEGFLSFLFRRSTVRRSKVGRKSQTDDVRRSLRRSLRRIFRRNDSFVRAQDESDIIVQTENAAATPDRIERATRDVSVARVSQEIAPDSSIRTGDVQLTRPLDERTGHHNVGFTINRVSVPIILTPPSPVLSPGNGNLGSAMQNSAHAAVAESESSRSADSPQPPSRPRPPAEEPPNHETDEERCKRVGFWPHVPSSLLAVLACTLGMGNICRFSFLCFQYGGGFILQFIMLSVSLGFPMLSFFMTLGQYMGTGIMDMWKISPVFQGVGVASLIATTLLGIYTIIPVSWLFVYFRDSFITNGVIFRWGECSSIFRQDYMTCRSQNSTEAFRKTVPEYFHGKVLQRSNLYPAPIAFGELKFENVFNLAVVWMLVFICLSKGLKSYGKVVFVLAFFPLIGILLVSVELLRQAENGTEYIMNMNTYIIDAFTSGASWVAAAREVFFTWGLNGAAIMQITSHNRFRHNIKRDSTVVILVTMSTLLVVGFLSCACFAIIFKYERGAIYYLASSFEIERNLLFLAPNPDPKIPLRYHWSNNLLLGSEMMTNHMDVTHDSNYQVFRLVTELFPAALANLGARNISPFWSVLFYLTLITFALAQQLAIWRCAIEGIIAIQPKALRSWETTITFIMCVMGFILGLPATSELGIFVIYFLDFCIGSAWWIMIIYLVLILAVFIVRGKPFSADDLVSLMARDKFTRKWLSNLISFSWSVIVPIGLLVLAITSFRNGKYNRIFSWFDNMGYRYWPSWVRQIGTFIQILPLLAIPLVGCIQTCRYLATGPPDLFDRLQMLYRPVLRTPPDGQQTEDSRSQTNGVINPGFTEDPPPKYTPPPSYNTATGLKLLKRLNSLRRSLRAQFPSRGASASTSVPVDIELNQQGAQNVPIFVLSGDLPSTSRTQNIHLI